MNDLAASSTIERPTTRAEKAEVARRHANYILASAPDTEMAGFKIGLPALTLQWELAAMRRDALVLAAIADDYARAT